MTTAAADPWMDTENAEDFWDNDLGSIDDDADWDVDLSATAENTQPDLTSAAQTISRSNEEELSESIGDKVASDAPLLEAKSGVKKGPETTDTKQTGEHETGEHEEDLEDEDLEEAGTESKGSEHIESENPELPSELPSELSSELDTPGTDHDTVPVTKLGTDDFSGTENHIHVDSRNEDIEINGMDSNGIVSGPTIESTVDGAVETPSEVSSKPLFASQDPVSVPVEEHLKTDIEPSLFDADVVNESATPVLEPKEPKDDLSNDLKSNALSESTLVLPNETTEYEVVETTESLVPETVSHEQVRPEQQMESPDLNGFSSESALISENLAEQPADEPQEPESSELVQEPESSELESKEIESKEPKAHVSHDSAGLNPEVSEIITQDEPEVKFTPEQLTGTLDSRDVALAPSVESSQNEVDMLKSQIQQLKKELEAKSIQEDVGVSPHAELESRLEEAEKERDDAKRQLEGFLSKISSMKTVVRNYKLTQEELEETQQEVAQLKEKAEALEQEKIASEEENLQLLVQKEKLETRVAELESEAEKSANTIQELKTGSGDLNSECERLSQQLSTLRREFSSKDETLQDEKYALENEVSKLSKKINEIKASYSELELAEGDLRMENKNLSLMIEELRGSLVAKEKEEERFTGLIESNKRTFEEEKNSLQSKIQEIEQELQSTQNQLAQSQHENSQLLEKVQQGEEQRAKLAEENEKITQLQEEIHSKQVIIGKLRHEAVILNEHLTKSLSMLKQNSGDTDSTVDKELVSNLIVKFVQIPRGDAKKFETLSLIGGLLNWDEKRKMEAGLLNSGAKAGDDGKPPARSSIISLWTDFLDKESKNRS